MVRPIRKRNLRGGSLLSRLHGLIFGATRPPKAIEDLLKNHGNEQILAITICRKPIISGVEQAAKFLSAGKLQQLMKQFSYDHLFHLYAYVVTDRATHFLIEKNELIKVRYNPDSTVVNSQCIGVPMAPGNRPTVRQFWERAYSQNGVNLIRYSAFQYNCQHFILSLLKGSHLLNPQLQAFIYQDPAEIIRTLPTGIGTFTNLVTGLAARLSLLRGEGLRRTRLLKRRRQQLRVLLS